MEEELQKEERKRGEGRPEMWRTDAADPKRQTKRRDTSIWSSKLAG
jgi:hypothetical protein